jgi:hypothetical protein
MRTSTGIALHCNEVDKMQDRNGRIGNGAAYGSDMFCRSIVAAVAAMLALKLCQIIRRWLHG